MTMHEAMQVTKKGSKPQPEKPSRTVADIEMRADRIKAVNVAENKSLKKIRKTTTAAEKNDLAKGEKATGATGLTLLKRTVKSPIDRLVDTRKIGPEEVQAAADLTTAFMAKSGALIIHPLSLERIDRGSSYFERAAAIDAQQRYKKWADYWSKLAKCGDKTLQIVIAAVIDERPFNVIETDLQIGHGKAQLAVIRGLRDYAARVVDDKGKPMWVDRRCAVEWISMALDTFRVLTPRLSLAAARARNAKC